MNDNNNRLAAASPRKKLALIGLFGALLVGFFHFRFGQPYQLSRIGRK